MKFKTFTNILFFIMIIIIHYMCLALSEIIKNEDILAAIAVVGIVLYIPIVYVIAKLTPNWN